MTIININMKNRGKLNKLNKKKLFDLRYYFVGILKIYSK